MSQPEEHIRVRVEILGHQWLKFADTPAKVTVVLGVFQGRICTWLYNRTEDSYRNIRYHDSLDEAEEVLKQRIRYHGGVIRGSR